MKSIDVIIPTFNGCDLLTQCLDHLRSQDTAHQVIVVDNASSDETVSVVTSKYPEVKLVRQQKNNGYGAAVNAGVAAGEGEALVIINNDVFCEPEFVGQVVEPLDIPGRVGMVAGLLLQPGQELVDSFGIEIDSSLAAYNRLWRCPRDEAIKKPDAPVLGPNGGAAAYLRSAFEEVGGFDEALFAYSEDVDLDLRLKLAGWTCVLAATAIAMHLGGATAGLGSAWQLKSSSFGRWFVLRRYGVLRPSPRGLYVFLFESLVALARSLVKRDIAILMACIRGWRAGGGLRYSVPDGTVNSGIGLGERLRRRLSNCLTLCH